MRFLTYMTRPDHQVLPNCLRKPCCSTDLISKLVTGKTQDHQPMGVLALELVQLTVVPGGGASERGHILYQDHPAPEHVKVHRVSLQRGGPQVVEGLGDERHLDSCASSLEADGISTRDCIKLLGHLTHLGQKAAFHGCQMTLQETDLHLTFNTLYKFILG